MRGPPLHRRCQPQVPAHESHVLNGREHDLLSTGGKPIVKIAQALFFTVGVALVVLACHSCHSCHSSTKRALNLQVYA